MMSDRALVTRIVEQRCETSFRELVERHAGAVLRLAQAITRDRQAAEDATQETFLVVSRKLRRFDLTRSLRPWILGIAYRNAKRIAGRRARVAAREESAMSETNAPLGPDTAAQRRETARRLSEEIDRLPAPQRAAVHLHYREGLTIAEAAAVLGIPAGTAKSRIGRALETLRGSLGGSGLALTALLAELPRAEAGPALVDACVKKGVAGLAAPALTLKATLAAALVLTAGTMVAVVSTRDDPLRADTRETVADADGMGRGEGKSPAGVPAASPRPEPAPKDVGTPEADADDGPYVVVAGKRVSVKELLADKNSIRVGPDGRVQRGPIVMPGDGKPKLGGAPVTAPGRLGKDGKWQWPKGPRFPPPPRHYGDATLAGRVVDETGTPVPGAEVWRIVADAPREETTAISAEHMDKIATTDARGRFVLAKQKAGDVLLMANFQGVLTVPGVGLETRHAVAVTARPGATTGGIVLRVPVVLGDFATLRGVVRDSEGKPVAGAQVWLDTRLRRSSARNGTFDLGLVPAGPQLLRVQQVGLEPQEIPLTLAPKEVRAVEVTMPYLSTGTLRLAGQVLDQAGQPVVGATVYLGAGSGTVRKQLSDARGHYAFEKLPNELTELTVTLHVWPPEGYFPAYRKDITLPQDAFDVRLERSFQLAVRVTSASGAPVRQVNYRLLVPVEREAGRMEWIAKTTGGHFTDDGRLTDLTVPAGKPARLWVEAPGHEPWERDLATDTDAREVELTVELTPSATPEPDGE